MQYQPRQAGTNFDLFGINQKQKMPDQAKRLVRAEILNRAEIRGAISNKSNTARTEGEVVRIA